MSKYDEEFVIRGLAIICAFLGLAFIGGGTGGVTSGEPSGWVGVGIGALMWVYAGWVFVDWMRGGGE